MRTHNEMVRAAVERAAARLDEDTRAAAMVTLRDRALAMAIDHHRNRSGDEVVETALEFLDFLLGNT